MTPKARITVNVNGKDYIVCEPRVYRTTRYGVIVAYTYWPTRNGAAFGPQRTATEQHGKGVGAKLAAAGRAAFGIDNEAMIADYIARTESE